MIKITKAEPFPANTNPPSERRMRDRIGNNITLMYDTERDQRARSIIICNMETGERISIDFGDAPELPCATCKLVSEVGHDICLTYPPHHRPCNQGEMK